MRKLKSIASQVPISSGGEFDEATISEFSDIATTNLMATMTKGLEQITQMTEALKHNQYGNENSTKSQGRSGMAGFGSIQMEGMFSQFNQMTSGHGMPGMHGMQGMSFGGMRKKGGKGMRQKF